MKLHIITQQIIAVLIIITTAIGSLSYLYYDRYLEALVMLIILYSTDYALFNLRKEKF